MPIYRLQVSLQSDSGLPRDQFVNSIYVDTIADTDQDRVEWGASVGNFYNGIATYLSPVIADSGHTVKMYTVGAPLETPPRYTSQFQINGIAGTPLPNEVASCLSFKGAVHVGWQLQSTRGRIYLGPLNTGAMAAGEAGSVPSTGFRSAVTTAAAALAASIKLHGGVWGVYSKTHGAITPLTEISMDNEWDTQRSRGYRATLKTKVILPTG